MKFAQKEQLTSSKRIAKSHLACIYKMQNLNEKTEHATNCNADAPYLIKPFFTTAI